MKSAFSPGRFSGSLISTEALVVVAFVVGLEYSYVASVIVAVVSALLALPGSSVFIVLKSSTSCGLYTNKVLLRFAVVNVEDRYGVLIVIFLIFFPPFVEILNVVPGYRYNPPSSSVTRIWEAKCLEMLLLLSVAPLAICPAAANQ
ncbi:MAG: hypothetical protein K2H99_07280 [Paramuribaculum sp.]|nr:hypothetical protein [Paramuribaculum sp.]